MRNTLLEIKDLKTYFSVVEGTAKAVDGVSFTIDREKTIGIVGESGCGKSITALSILQIVPPPGSIVGGEILFYQHPDAPGVDLLKLDPEKPQMRAIRGKNIALIFQEPMTSLSPVHTIGHQIIETIRYHNKGMKKDEARARAVSVLKEVGMPNPESQLKAYTFQLSGGMRQRAMIAMALSCDPLLLIADEPTTAIDVTIQAKILELLQGLQQERGMSIMFITHDLGVIAEIADEVAVMYLGKIAERGKVADIFDNPFHPYTQALLRSIPMFDMQSKARLASIKGSVPAAYSIIKGCEFEQRCEKAIHGLCEQRKPAVTEVKDNHFVRCFLYE